MYLGFDNFLSFAALYAAGSYYTTTCVTKWHKCQVITLFSRRVLLLHFMVIIKFSRNAKKGPAYQRTKSSNKQEDLVQCSDHPLQQPQNYFSISGTLLFSPWLVGCWKRAHPGRGPSRSRVLAPHLAVFRVFCCIDNSARFWRGSVDLLTVSFGWASLEISLLIKCKELN